VRRIYPLNLVFICSFSALFLEIVLVRIFSVRLSYHFASLIIGISVFGLVAGSLFVHVKGKSLKIKPEESFILLCLLFSAHFVISSFLPFDHFRLLWNKSEIIFLILLIFVVALPFFSYGFFLATCLKEFSRISWLVYGTDLIGGACGAILAPRALDIFKPEVCLGILFMVLSIYSITFLGRLKTPSSILQSLTSLTLSFFVILGYVGIPIGEYKSLSILLRMGETKLLRTINSRDSRLDILVNPHFRYAPGLSLTYRAPVPSGYLISRDGEVSGAFMADKEMEAKDLMKYMPSYAPYVLKREPKNVLMVGLKSNTDFLAALFANAKNLFVTEKDRSIKKFVESFYGRGSMYGRSLVLENSRNFLKKIRTKMDIIVISRTPYFLQGNFGLEEDYETTVEAFCQYFRALEEDGILYIQLFKIPPPRYEIRLFNNLREALQRSNIWPMDKHVIIFSSWDTVSFMVKKNGYLLSEMWRVRTFLEEMMFQPVYPHSLVKNRYVEGLGEDIIGHMYSLACPEILKNYPFDVRITEDDRPFFNYFLKLSKIPDLSRITRKGLDYFIHEGATLPFLLFFLIILAVFAITPVLLKKKWKVEKPILAGTYFCAIGVGFMFLEVFFVHRFILFYASPIDSFSSVLASFLVGAGVGSTMTRLIRGRTLIILMCASLVPNFMTYISLPICDNVFFLLAYGFFLGLFFPSGLNVLCNNDPKLLPFAYALNGVSSVIAPPLASLAAISFGLKFLLIVSAISYVISISILGLRRFRPAQCLFP